MRGTNVKLKSRTYFLLILPVFLLNTELARANPIVLDTAQEGNPFSPNLDSSIIFHEENVSVYFINDLANVYTNYTFFNPTEKSETIQILLPFNTEPTDILVNSIKIINYKFTNITETIKKESQLILYRGYSAITFNVTMQPNNFTSIYTTYSRSYEKYEFFENKEGYYSFSYIISTTRAWNKPLEKAIFAFYISNKIIDEDPHISGFPNATINESVDFTIISITLINWMPEDTDEIMVIWNNPNPKYNIFGIQGFSMAPIIFLSLPLVYVKKKKRK